MSDARTATPQCVAITGPCGAGKSTVIAVLEALLDVQSLHVGRFCKAQGFAADEAVKALGGLQEVPDAFYAQIEARMAEGTCLLDGFPRTVEQAKRLREIAPQALVVWLDVDSQTANARMMARDGGWTARQAGKAARSQTVDRAAAVEAGAVFVDASGDALATEAGVRKALGLSLGDMPWDWACLRALEAAAKAAGAGPTDVWACGSHGYGPLLVGLGHGPVVASRDVDVSAATEELAERLRRLLPPGWNWAVKGGERWTELPPETWRRLWVRCQDRRVVLRDIAAEGRVRRMAWTQADLASPVWPRLVARFPGVAGKRVLTAWEDIQAAVESAEHGGRRDSAILAPWEEQVAQDVRAFYASAHRGASAPTLPPLDGPKFKGVPLSEALRLTDGGWCDWVLREILGTRANHGQDPWIARIRSAFGDVEQKPTHQGTTLVLHAAYCAAGLDTVGLSEDDRVALRVAALLHDVGKLWNGDTPGAHSATGARMILHQGWLPAEASHVGWKVVQLVRLHDLPGRMLRGLDEAQYRGYCAPASGRRIIADAQIPAELVLRLWSADVNSVAALRWILPAVPLARKLLQAE